jgi:aryl-alcohol dehydrogenase-like predicted oxidoreductase
VLQKRPLGKTGIDVSEVSFGGVEIGIPYGIGVESQDDMPGEQEAVELLRAAVDRGINFFDTAHFYGRSETIMGKAFKPVRDRVVICTKNKRLCGDHDPIPETNQIRAQLDGSIQKSLSALQTDYLDGFMLHNRSNDLEMLTHPDVIERFVAYKKEGLTRFIGASVYGLEETRAAIESGVWDIIQISYNLMDQRLGALFPLARKNGVGLVIRSVLFRGILTDRGRDLHPKLESIKQHRERYSELLQENASTLTDLATKFVLTHREVSTVLIGMERMEYLEKAMAMADGNYLNEETLAKAGTMAYPDPEFIDLPKWDRAGWV